MSAYFPTGTEVLESRAACEEALTDTGMIPCALK
jgi:hypothetical protein